MHLYAFVDIVGIMYASVYTTMFCKFCGESPQLLYRTDGRVDRPGFCGICCISSWDR